MSGHTQPQSPPAIPSPLLEVRNLAVEYRVRQGLVAARRLPALAGVSFTLARGETLGVVGESGSGKSTLARALLNLVPASGSVRFAGHELFGQSAAALRPLRRQMQIVFQDPLAALDPRLSVGEIIGEPLREFMPQLGSAARLERVLAIMRRVGLEAAQLNRYPHEFSGGQAQRIGIARALILEPALVICDEPVAALDVSIKSQIINLLIDLQQQLQLTLLFIAHDLAAVRQLCDRVLVLYLGRVMELAPRDPIYNRSLHPYTRALLAAVPDPARGSAHRSTPLGGEMPSPLSPPSGCVFRTRCPLAAPRCAREVPPLRPLGASLVACHLAD